MRFITGLAIMLLLPCGPASAQAPKASKDQPYDLRGIRLGITQAEFRQAKPPEGRDASVMCTGDAQIMELAPQREEEQDGIVICQFLVRKTDLFGHTWRGATMTVGTVQLSPRFAFARDDSGVSRLYAIDVIANNSEWPKFIEGLTTKFGPPASVENGTATNGYGARFSAAKHVWRNGASSITLYERISTADTTLLAYKHTALAKEVDRRRAKRKGRPADSL